MWHCERKKNRVAYFLSKRLLQKAFKTTICLFPCSKSKARTFFFFILFEHKKPDEAFLSNRNPFLLRNADGHEIEGKNNILSLWRLGVTFYGHNWSTADVSCLRRVRVWSVPCHRESSHSRWTWAHRYVVRQYNFYPRELDQRTFQVSDEYGCISMSP